MIKRDLSDFDWQELGKLDAAMWRAYYNHQFVRLFLLPLRFVKTQLGYGWPITIRLAYYSAWTAMDYRIHRRSGTNNQRITDNLTRFYQLIAERSTRPFDYRLAAELELAWWEIHRKSQANSPELEKALAKGVAAIHGVSASRLKEYAHYRAEAMFLPAHQGDKQRGHPIDWAEVQDLTTKSWHALWVAVQR